MRQREILVLDGWKTGGGSQKHAAFWTSTSYSASRHQSLLDGEKRPILLNSKDSRKAIISTLLRPRNGTFSLG